MYVNMHNVNWNIQLILLKNYTEEFKQTTIYNLVLCL